MNLTDKQIREFIDAWQNDFGETLSPETAEMEANRLLDFFAEMTDALNSPAQAEEIVEKPGDLRAAWEQMMRRARTDRYI